MEYSQYEMVFLDTKIVATPLADRKVAITDTHQYLNPNSCHSKYQTKNVSFGVADRIRRNCSVNIVNDVTNRKRPIKYKAYLMKPGHSKKYR